MADIVTQRNIGAYAVPVTSVFPQNSAAATVNGSAIDRMQHNMAGSCVLHQAVGAVSGSPSAVSVQTLIEHSPDASTWSDYEIISETPIETAALTAADTENSVPVDLTGAYRYIRASTTISFTGGTSPEAEVLADFIIGGERELVAV